MCKGYRILCCKNNFVDCRGRVRCYWSYGLGLGLGLGREPGGLVNITARHLLTTPVDWPTAWVGLIVASVWPCVCLSVCLSALWKQNDLSCHNTKVDWDNDSGMDWPWGQKVKDGSGLGLELGFGEMAGSACRYDCTYFLIDVVFVSWRREVWIVLNASQFARWRDT